MLNSCYISRDLASTFVQVSYVFNNDYVHVAGVLVMRHWSCQICTAVFQWQEWWTLSMFQSLLESSCIMLFVIEYLAW